MRRIRGRSVTVGEVNSWVDAIFDCIGSTSGRWSFFDFDTDSPTVFTRIQCHYSTLYMGSLSSFQLSFSHLPGYYPQLNYSDAIVPFSPRVWFQSRALRITELSLFCVPLLWDGDVVFDRLERVEISDVTGLVPVPQHFLPALFIVATHLRYLCLGVIHAFTLPASHRLFSLSLEEFSRTVLSWEIFSLRSMHPTSESSLCAKFMASCTVYWLALICFSALPVSVSTATLVTIPTLAPIFPCSIPLVQCLNFIRWIWRIRILVFLLPIASGHITARDLAKSVWCMASSVSTFPRWILAWSLLSSTSWPSLCHLM
ncbi:hypothetical protein B0H13DRAFT_2305581 [Mycena leptocephala]|nr:hypothetical protein B0H13DRAFT_2305581 [Mycena leptocephala]